jgi:hypothetical protein
MAFPAITCLADRLGHFESFRRAVSSSRTIDDSFIAEIESVTRSMYTSARPSLKNIVAGASQELRSYLLVQHFARNDFARFVDQYERFPYHAIYLGSAREERRRPFLSKAFWALHRLTGRTLTVHFNADHLRSDLGDWEEGWFSNVLQAVGVTEQPKEHSLIVWKRPAESRRGNRFPTMRARSEPNQQAEAASVSLKNFHDEARIGAIVTLTTQLQLGDSLRDAAARAESAPAEVDSRVLQELLPGASIRDRQRAKRWGREFTERHGGAPEAAAAAKLLSLAARSSRAPQTRANAILAATLTLTGLLGAPHVLTHDLPESTKVIVEVLTSIMDSDQWGASSD